MTPSRHPPLAIEPETREHAAMDCLAFARADLEALGAWFAAQEGPHGSEWHLTHNLFFPSEEARAAAERALSAQGLHTSYVDTIDDALRPFWLDMMEPVTPQVAEVEDRLRRVVAAIGPHDGEYNSFTLIGSRGESFPPSGR